MQYVHSCLPSFPRVMSGGVLKEAVFAWLRVAHCCSTCCSLRLERLECPAARHIFGQKPSL